MKRVLSVLIAAAAAASALPASAAASPATETSDRPSAAAAPASASKIPGDPTRATFEGTTFDLSKGWGEANACHVAEDGTRCYRTEAEMDEKEGLAATEASSLSGDDVVAAVACAPAVRLYDYAFYGGQTLTLTIQYTYMNLNSYLFDNRTSSYRIGACNSALYDTTSAGGLYPGNTSATAFAPNMAAGWDNRIGSAYIA